MIRLHNLLSSLAVLAFAESVLAQTIVVNGQEVAANEVTVAPAFEEFPGSDSPEATFQLTEAILSNLTQLELSSISLFQFADAGETSAIGSSGSTKCKTFPGDSSYPNESAWNVLDLLTGGALIETVPIGAACYPGDYYNATYCQFLLDNYSDAQTFDEHPTAVMSPLFEGATCEPQNAATGGVCSIGGFPLYSVKATNVAQIQLAINFARNLNIRLVVRNTGHDFLGKSTGAGSLNIWTHNLKNIQLIENYKSAGNYTGPVFKLGAGVQVFELYAAADEAGFTAVGGECPTVGVSGGYTAGGGHSPMSPLVGLGADQVLSVDIVTPDGRFITADESQNTDLFWAIRGGGGATWGVVTSMTVKVHPKTGFSGLEFIVNSGAQNISDTTFWAIVGAYWRRLAEITNQNSYGYSAIFPLGPGAGYLWRMQPWIVPNTALSDFKSMVQPLLDEWTTLGVVIEPTFFEYDNLYETWLNHFPVETVGLAQIRTASRIFPKKNWESPELLNDTISALISIISEGSALVQFNMHAAAPVGTPSNAANPAWRDAVMFSIIGTSWDAGADPEQVEIINKKITDDWMGRLRNVTPGGGGYGNEGDVMEPDFGQAFFGTNYPRLYELKQKVDPWGVFYAPTAVGSEDWYIEDQGWLTLQTGRLCRKS